LPRHAFADEGGLDRDVARAEAAPDNKMKPVLEERIIVIDPEIMNGTPCFRGMRVPFKNLIDYLEGGHSLGEFPRQFPTVTVI